MVMTCRQAAELDHALERGDWTSEYVKQACSGDFLSKVLGLLREDCKLEVVDRVIDCNTNPVIPEGHTLVRHTKYGMIKWNSLLFENVDMEDLVPSDGDLDEEMLLPKFLVGMCNLPNANLQQYLLQYPHLVPKEWPGLVPFWGTIFKDEEGCPYVACIEASRLSGSPPREYILSVNKHVHYSYNAVVMV